MGNETKDVPERISNKEQGLKNEEVDSKIELLLKQSLPLFFILHSLFIIRLFTFLRFAEKSEAPIVIGAP
jgi:hypothetical protein